MEDKLLFQNILDVNSISISNMQSSRISKILSLSLTFFSLFKLCLLVKRGQKRYSGQYWFATTSALFMQCKHSCIGCKCTDFFLLSNSCFLLYFESACIYKYAPFLGQYRDLPHIFILLHSLTHCGKLLSFLRCLYDA